jgi:hypothetical protein
MKFTRRAFLGSSFIVTAGGLFVPEWLLDPPKGRSMVAVADFAMRGDSVIFLSPYPGFVQVLRPDLRVYFHGGRAVVSDKETIALMRQRIACNLVRRDPQHPVERSFGNQPFIELKVK